MKHDDCQNKRVTVLFWVFGLAAVWPFVFLPFLPTVDLPHHAAVTAMLSHSQNSEFANYYTASWTDSPYVLFYGVCAALARVVGAAKAVHLFVAGTIVLYLTLVRKAAIIFRAPDWTVFLAFPVLFNSVFFWGFASFYFSVVMALAAFVFIAAGNLEKSQTTHQQNREKRVVLRLPPGFVLMGFSLLAALSHAYGAAFLVLFLGLGLVAFRKHWRPLVAPFIALVPILVAWLSVDNLKSPQASSESLWQKLAAFWGPNISYKLQNWKRLLFWGPQYDATAWLFAAMAVFLTLAFVAEKMQVIPTFSWKKMQRFFQMSRPTFSWEKIRKALQTDFSGPDGCMLWGRWAISLFFVLNLLAFFMVAEHVKTVSHVCLRHGVSALWALPFLAMGWLSQRKSYGQTRSKSMRFAKVRQQLPAGVAATLALASLIVINVVFVGFAIENSSLSLVIKRLPPGIKVLSIAQERTGKWFAQDVYLQQAYYAQAEKGGFFGFSFAWAFPHIPVRLRTDVPLPRLPYEWSHYGFAWFDYSRFGEDYDALIVHGPVPPMENVVKNYRWESFGSDWHIGWKKDLTKLAAAEN